jgi:hypothetical protein
MDCGRSTSATTTVTKRWRTHIIVMIASGAISGEEKLNRLVASENDHDVAPRAASRHFTSGRGRRDRRHDLR